jgi:hypothetical protein
VRAGDLMGDFGQIERLTHCDDGRDLAAGLGDGATHERVDRVGGATEEHQADGATGKQLVHSERVQASGERFLTGQLFLQVPGLLACLADFGLEVRDNAVLG